jgi:hypothetical protein
MDESDLAASGINFDAPATFRKWPLNGQRRIESYATALTTPPAAETDCKSSIP